MPRAPATAAGLALLLAFLAAPAGASSTWPVLLDVENQSGVPFLRWELAPAGLGPPPNVEAWIVTRLSDDGQSTEIPLPGGESSYTDTDVEPGRTYVYTVAYEEQGARSPPSNPVLFLGGCPLIIFHCIPIDPFPVPHLKPECFC